MRVLIDMDGIVADFLGHFINTYNECTHARVSKRDVTTWEVSDSLPDQRAAKKARQRLHSPSWWREMPLVCEKAPAIVQKWTRSHDVCFASTPWSEASYSAKAAWIQEHFPFTSRKQLALLAEKWHLKGDVIIDDKPKTLIEFGKHQPSSHRLSIMYAHHDDALAIEHGVYLAPDYLHPDRAWEHLDDYVMSL